MRNLFIIGFCVILSHFAIGQQRRVNSPIEGEYLEVRFINGQGMSYRLESDLPFQRTGLFNKNLKPYFNQYDESLRYRKQHNRSYLGIAGGSVMYSLGFTTVLFGLLESDANAVRGGSLAAIGGIGLMLWSNHRNITGLHKAVDAYNRNKNPKAANITHMEIFSHSLIGWQFRTNTSEDYKNVGFYGGKLKSHFQEDEAAYNAYKKYRAAHISYSVGNITMLTGTGMMFLGLLGNNSDFARTGLFTSVGGVVCVLVGSNVMNKNIYRAVDLINYKKLPALNSSLMPSLQPSSHSAGLGLVWNIQ